MGCHTLVLSNFKLLFPNKNDREIFKVWKSAYFDALHTGPKRVHIGNKYF